MIPQYILSTWPAPDKFYGARDSKRINDRLDFEDGGIGISDPSEGLLYQTWWAWIQTGIFYLDKELNKYIEYDPDGIAGVYIAAPNTIPTLILEGMNITEISFTFDQNCRPSLAFVQEGEAKLMWYDSNANAIVTTNLGNDIINPRVSLDDKREKSLLINDIILAYIRQSKLCYRQQRDRFEVEYVLKTGISGRLNKIGMGRGLRFQFQICKA